MNRDGPLTLDGKAQRAELVSYALLVRGFQKARPQVPVHRAGGTLCGTSRGPSVRDSEGLRVALILLSG